MALVRNDEVQGGKRNDFEATAACLLPHNPVSRKHNATQWNHQGGEAEVSAIDSSKIKSGIGKTGVDLRYHKRSKYDKLNSDQRKELHDWRENNPKDASKKTNPSHQRGGKSVSFNNNKKMKSMISSAVAAQLGESSNAPATDDTAQAEADRDYLLTLLTANANATATASSASAVPTTTPAVTLQSILKRAANSQS